MGDRELGSEWERVRDGRENWCWIIDYLVPFLFRLPHDYYKMTLHIPVKNVIINDHKCCIYSYSAICICNMLLGAFY